MEIYQIGETRLCPEGVDFYNPAFDVTPNSLITAIITEKGAVKPTELISLQ
jgi:methylthioribose-1-phosphate isomerase